MSRRPKPKHLPRARSAPVVERRAVVTVTGMSLEGDGLARTDAGEEVRVPFTLPGERVEVTLGRGGSARVERVLAPSPQRVAAPCPFFGPCGGCTWQHIGYAEQLRLKQRLVADLLAKALGAPVEVRPTLGIAGPDGAAPWGYRNKVHFVVGPDARSGTALGHYRRGTQDLLPVDRCPVHAPEGNRLAFAARDALARAPGRAAVRHVVVRTGEGSGQSQLTLVARDARFKGLREVTEALTSLERPPSGVHLNVNDRPQSSYVLGAETRKLHGRERLLEQLGDVRYLVSPQAFFQTSVRSAAVLVDAVLARVPADDSPVLDLFSGVGLFSLPLARRGHRVLAIEENAAAVQDGAFSRRFNELDEGRCRFVAEKAEVAVRRLRDEGRTFPTVLVDPPRDGCAPGLLELVLGGLRPARLIYVSCNPEALAADLVTARRLGWTITDVQPVDMFPHTAHVETLAVLAPGAGAHGRTGGGGRPR